MNQLQIAIEGTAALEATKELMTISEVSGDWQVSNEAQREITLATIATIVGIVGGTITAAEQIRKWYQEWKKGKSGKSIEKVVLVGKEKRLLLEGATIEEIKAVLDSL